MTDDRVFQQTARLGLRASVLRSRRRWCFQMPTYHCLYELGHLQFITGSASAGFRPGRLGLVELAFLLSRRQVYAGNGSTGRIQLQKQHHTGLISIAADLNCKVCASPASAIVSSIGVCDDKKGDVVATRVAWRLQSPLPSPLMKPNTRQKT
jgi:hypothetical protein